MSRTEYTIATANSRLSKAWHNCSRTWEWLCHRFEQCVRTPETAAQWKRLPKEERTTLKDVGGFVGGSLSGTRRGKGSVTSRSLLTIDFDEGIPADMVERCASLLGPIGYILHSTHSHTPDSQRFRLILPLCRDITTEEYEPLIRILLKRLDLLDAADTSTYEPSRLMYWPSCPSDGEYIIRYSSGRGIDPDKHLAKYEDWRDVRQWPISSKEVDIPHRRGRNAEDPTAKGGLVGDFCRIYDVFDILQKFPELYEATADPMRYNFIPGSVYGGTLVYEGGKFVFNHNEHNPAKGLCNAFDLYRIHRFGELDDDAPVRDDPTKLPSYTAMLDFLSRDEEFLAKLGEETQRKVHEDFAGIDLSQFGRDTRLHEEGSPENTAAAPVLTRDRKGKVECTIANAMTVLNSDRLLKGSIRYNEFTRMVERGPVPWNTVAGFWTDADEARLRAYMEKYGIRGSEIIADAVTNVAHTRRYHPVRDYLDHLPQWDGVERLDTIFIRFLGAEDTEIHRAMTRKQMVGAVKRIYEPGCKHDYCLVLSGPEGVGKSTMLRIMALVAHFNDSIVSIEGKDTIESLQGSWIVEFAELAGLNKSEVEMLKAFLTKCADKLRKAYGRHSEVYPRQCVFFGTTNEDHFLRGDRGNRRFWIIRIDPKLRRVAQDSWLDILREELPQIWAEAKYRYEHGEKNWLDGNLEPVARQMQEEFNEAAEDPMEEMLRNMLETKLPIDWFEYDIYSRRRWWQNPDTTAMCQRRQYFCVAEYLREIECLEFGSPLYKSRARKVGNLMRSKFADGWEYIGNSREVAGIHGKFQKAWKRKVQNLDEEDL